MANLISINKIVTIHYYEFDKNFSFEGESHNFWEMVYIDSGEVEINARNNRFLLKQGEMNVRHQDYIRLFHTDSAEFVRLGYRHIRFYPGEQVSLVFC